MIRYAVLSPTMRLRFIITASAFLSACTCLPPAPPSQCEQIPGIPGPEDFVVDRNTTGDRLIVSSHERRSWRPGSIYALSLSARHEIVEMLRENEPEGFELRPHGMDMKTINGQRRLYVITHGAEQNGSDHSVVVYTVTGNVLRFERKISDTLLASPNDLALLDDGSFYTSIDSVSRGSMIDLLFSLKTGRIVYCSAGSACTIAYDKIAFPNGAIVQGSYLYATASPENRLMRFRIREDRTLESPETLAEIPVGDNLMQTDAGLLSTSHPSGWSFLQHARNAENHAPSVVYQYNNGTMRALLADDGRRISAASVAYINDDTLYIGQVFDPFLLRCRFHTGSP
ncbi:MAG: hypothetical protein CVV45_10105 [Spirochaetae bacterium HGW-Spirochaetae-10]|nr:MAG: hypothetical protein CVV45_10105 [Spirochaetae bacterium HGW-Spirochaetae-10]